jgi:OmpA-OmpF porin, OOP family
MRAHSIVSILWFLVLAAPAVAKPAVPTADLPGSQDNPLIGRFQGSLIVSHERKSEADFSLPLSALEKVEGKTDNHNNYLFAPKQKKDLVGKYTRLIYLIPPERSTREVARNYSEDVQRQGGKVLFSCEGDACGGDPKRNSSGGGGRMSLSMYLYPIETFTDKYQDPGACLMRAQISDRRYLAAELPKSGAFLSVYTFNVEPNACDGPLGNRTVALVQIIEGAAKDSKLSVPSAAELAQSIGSQGRAAVYGIYFDSGQAELKPQSSPTLEQIAKLLQDKPSLKVLIVGHTDNVGGYAANVDLSQRRAKAVVAALTSQYKIAGNRLTPVGLSSASPLDSNKTEDGRVKNRRVEIVEQ